MPLLAIPNISSSDPETTRACVESVRGPDVHVLDVHTDEIHERTVLTMAGPASALPVAIYRLTETALRRIDLTTYRGSHPRVGAVDVCPFVPLGDTPMSKAVAVARTTARRIADDLGLPAYLYGESSQRKLTLPEIRRGGLEGLIRRTEDGFLPDLGPTDIDPTRGAICIGAREVLIAFNVWLELAASAAREIARSIREADGGLPGVRAIGLDMGGGLCQVSMNLTAPHITGIEAAFAAISSAANRLGGRITRTELVGLPPARYLPGPDAETARLMDPPGRSLESMLP